MLLDQTRGRVWNSIALGSVLHKHRQRGHWHLFRQHYTEVVLQSQTERKQSPKVQHTHPPIQFEVEYTVYLQVRGGWHQATLSVDNKKEQQMKKKIK